MSQLTWRHKHRLPADNKHRVRSQYIREVRKDLQKREMCLQPPAETNALLSLTSQSADLQKFVSALFLLSAEFTSRTEAHDGA